MSHIAFWAKTILLLFVVAGYASYTSQQNVANTQSDVATSLKQLDDPSGEAHRELATSHVNRNTQYVLGWTIIAVVGVVLYLGDIMFVFRKAGLLGCVALILLSSTGCRRPFEPQDLQVIESHEVGFLIPFTDDGSKQAVSQNEDFFRKNLVLTQQVKIPQQWIPTGYETFGPNGNWKPAAILIKVNTSPETRVWTADANSGTSSKNEAIWVMTSDQVEFSTGWECTAQIKSKEDSVKFLHNYPNGSLAKVMDLEIRSKIQTAFAIEVTDLPMDELRKKATPHIQSVVAEVKEYFLEKGITITNLGISGGFVYKDPSIIATMVRVFNAEQEKSIAMADTAAQTEKNKTIQLTADSKAKALLTEKEAEADGIKLVADAKSYEIEKAQEKADLYLALKRIEIESEKLQKWDGKFPVYFMGGGAEGMNLLLQAPNLPAPAPEPVKKEEPKKVVVEEQKTAVVDPVTLPKGF